MTLSQTRIRSTARVKSNGDSEGNYYFKVYLTDFCCASKAAHFVFVRSKNQNSNN